MTRISPSRSLISPESDLSCFSSPKRERRSAHTQACGFRDAFPRIEAAGATVIGISPDSPKALAKWKANQHLPYMLLSDPDHKIAERFGAWGERSMYGLKFQGIIRSHFVFNADGTVQSRGSKSKPQKQH